MRAPFFAAIAAGLLSSWLIGHQWIAAILLALWLLRVVMLKDRHCLVVTVLITIGMGCWFSWQNHVFTQITQTAPKVQTLALTVQPDAINTRGGQYQLVGVSPQYGKLIVYGKLESAAHKQQLDQLTQKTTWQVTGTLSPVAPPTNPGQFNAPNYYRGLGINRQYTVTHVASLTTAPSTGYWHLIDQIHAWRAHFAHASQHLPPTLQLYASSLLIGMRPASFHTAMVGVQQLGLLHLFSLSGMHVILFLGLLRWGLIRGHLSLATIDWLLLGWLPIYLVLGGGADSLTARSHDGGIADYLAALDASTPS